MSKLAHLASILLFAIGGAHPMFAQAAIQEPGANALYHPNADVVLGNRPFAPPFETMNAFARTKRAS